MVRELDIADLAEPVSCLTLRARAAIFAARAEHTVTYLLHEGERVAMIAPCGSLETGYSELEAALAELARLQEPYQRQLVRVRELIAQENASLQG
jgi:hypothetical protein